MIRGNLHPFCEIEAVRIEALHTRIELHLFAVMIARFLDEPVEQLTAEAARTIGRPRNQIVHVEKLSGTQRFEGAINCDRPDLIFGCEKSEKISLFLLTLHTIDKFLGVFDVGAQLVHYRKTTAHLICLLSDCYPRRYHTFVSRLPSYQRSSASRER